MNYTDGKFHSDYMMHLRYMGMRLAEKRVSEVSSTVSYEDIFKLSWPVIFTRKTKSADTQCLGVCVCEGHPGSWLRAEWVWPCCWWYCVIPKIRALHSHLKQIGAIERTLSKFQKRYLFPQIKECVNFNFQLNPYLSKLKRSTGMWISNY